MFALLSLTTLSVLTLWFMTRAFGVNELGEDQEESVGREHRESKRLTPLALGWRRFQGKTAPTSTQTATKMSLHHLSGILLLPAIVRGAKPNIAKDSISVIPVTAH